jgi:metal-sulfur cluster biosynthetic enzyme
VIETPPGWLPNQNPSVDPSLHATLDDIPDHDETKQEYIEKIKDQLKTVYDPEISVDLYTLGLIYDVKVTSERYVFVLMSLTSAFCPAADSMPIEIKQKIESIPGLKCKVRITMTPQWNRDMIEPSMRDLMGL